jgi:hypothetical protein
MRAFASAVDTFKSDELAFHPPPYFAN